jgi:hypothetical protein
MSDDNKKLTEFSQFRHFANKKTPVKVLTEEEKDETDQPIYDQPPG